MAFRPVKEQLEIIKRGTVEIISEEELVKKLERSYKTGKPLVIKAGFDPTAPDIHLGHTVLLRKLKQFLDLGHEIKFLIGDFTGMIGDPTGKSEIRKQLNREQVIANAKTYQLQVSKVLKKTVEPVFNSAWFEKMSPYEFLSLTSHLTVAQLLAREDFKQRYSSGKDISVLEFIYPLLQGYDSVELKADVEMGGTDQKFNLLAGRQLQKDWNQEQQCVLMMPLLEGLDGVQKMSKSLNNYVGIDEPAETMFAKLMSISDTLMFRYYELLTDLPLADIETYKREIKEGARHPKKCKEALAGEITAYYYAEEAARQAAGVFNSRFSGGTDWNNPDNFEAKSLKKSEWKDGKLWVCKMLTLSGACASNSDARRLVQQKAVVLDGETISDAGLELSLPQPHYLLKVGKKKFIKITVDE
ncbi:MAG: tyrosine--tRNA ligase [Candidatus Omnitrophica bacterium]|nr:tyrosine--tRNA ligase [Candidatus Omnitrophota bacterium]MBU4479426.1 tyrosine--tRNA ligase [Candidatus Omnitrophota bacterium]MCG2703971.1 tyrosine--tRNA ligase [Candidatus Omnitrophota bacterium]